MTTELLDALPLWGFFVLATTFSVLSLEGGYRFGRWRHTRRWDEKDAPVGAMVGSILGLVAIMMAFTFNLAASRFDARRQAVLEEANAIGTTYLRARLLPEPERTEVARMLREYVDVRVSIVSGSQVAEVLAESEHLHEKLWSMGTAAADRDTHSIMTGLFLQSLNDVIDLHAKRVLVGLRSRLPFAVWIALFTLAAVGMLSVGYQAGLSGTRRTPAELFLAFAFAAVLYLIVDLDRGHSGLLKVSQEAMIDLQKTLHATKR